jgi:hypothetical protein
MTEEEAKKRVCPFMVRRIILPQGASIEARACLASECMAWRQMKQLYRHANSGEGYVSEDRTDVYNNRGEPLPRTGYCGLAGKGDGE